MTTQAITADRSATPGALLRLALTADAVASGANGLAYLASSALLDGWLGVPTGLLLALGPFLAVYGTLVLRVATLTPIPRAAAAAVIAGNAAWVAVSLLALALDWFSPTLAGEIVIAVQAIAVAALAAAQYAGLRR
jgi:hypothetical protein